MKIFQLVNTKIVLLTFISMILLINAESKAVAQNGFLNPDIDLAVSNLALQPDGKILISGSFNNVGGQPRSKVARLNSNGTLDTSFQNPSITGEFNNDGVFALALQTDGKVIIGGLFNSVSGQTRNRLARLNSDGTLDTGFMPEVNNTVTAIVLQPDGKILIGGYFTLVGGQTRSRVARLNSDGTIDSDFENPNVNVANGSTAYPIGTIAVQPDGKILIGGYFNSVGGQSRSGVARLNSDGTPDASFNLTIDGIVSQFDFQSDGKILICGFFRFVNGAPRTGIARINLDGSLDASFQNVNISSGTVNAFDVQSDGKVIIGGNFSNINEQERRYLARLNANGTFDPGFQDPNANFGGDFYTINKILVQPDGKVLIGGQFDTVGRQPRKNLVRLLGDGSLDLPPAQTLTVTKTADTNDGVCNSDCSLREAIAAANASIEASQINFDAQFFSVPQNITLTSGELVIADNHRLTISGTGANLITISGNNQSRVFAINRDAVVLISNLTISGGNGAGSFDSGNGGGIYVSPNGSNTTLTLNNVTVRNNRGLAGGGIYILGLATVNINNSTFTENTATYNYGGGGIYLYLGSLNITNSTITKNVATFKPGGGGGIAVGTSSAIFTVTNSIITENTADSAGGISAGGTGTISNSIISNNRANGIAGGLYSGGTLNLIDSTVSGNTVINSDSSGGGIFNFGKLTASNSVITNNSAAVGGGVFTSGGLNATNLNISNNTSSNGGAGIYNNTGGSTTLPVSLNNSVISGNNSTGFGGGIYNRDEVKLTNTTVKNNSSRLGGGGIFNVFLNVGAATLNGTNSTISGNISNAAGGGISNQTGTVNLTNSTVSINAAQGIGGGINNNSNGKINLTNVTIAFNTAVVGTGGGVNNSGNPVNARNTIIGRNFAGGNARTSSDFSGTLNSQGYNLIGATNGTTITGTTTGNILGRDPQLLPLGDYGGPTQTVALQGTSPAVDAGDPSSLQGTDQRGFTRPRDGNGDGIDRADIGAFEVRSVVVTNVNDNGAGSLRRAVADAATSGDAIIFNASAFSTTQTITLTNGELVIPSGSNFTINGIGQDRLTISGNNQSRIFSIAKGANAVINDITIVDGNIVNAGGGGIDNKGSLTINNSVVRNNRSFGGGGGIYTEGILIINNSVVKDNNAGFRSGGIGNVFGNLTINNSIISNNNPGGIDNSAGLVSIDNSIINNNVAGSGISNFNRGTVGISNSTIYSNTSYAEGVGSGGGGVLNGNSTLTIINSTISNNKSQGQGGGIANFNGTTNLTNATIAFNATKISGGGIYNTGTNGTVNAINTFIANNTADDSAPNFSGTLSSQGYNLIQNTNGTNITGTTTGNLLNVESLLDSELRNNGGTTLTHALRLNSPAIDAGSAVVGLTTDQRGFIRPFDFLSVPNAAGGNGSDIGAYERQSSDVTRNSLFDFDGDGKANVSVYRPSSGYWYILKPDSSYSTVQLGDSTDKLVPADYDGDGRTDIAVWRENPSNPDRANFYILNSRDGTLRVEQFGRTGDSSVAVGDYDGDGKADPAVYRAGTAGGQSFFFYKPSTQPNVDFVSAGWGIGEDKPVAADYDGDGRMDVAVYRPSNGVWYIARSGGGFSFVQFGISTDKPVVGDYDGDGKADQAVYRPENGVWYINQSSRGFAAAQFGISTDLPTPADYDGDGKTDIAVFRPAEGNWYIQRSNLGFSSVQFGLSGDKPTPNAFVP